MDDNDFDEEFEEELDEDSWDKISKTRPLGVTILALLQIGGALLSTLYTFSFYFNKSQINELLGSSFTEIFIVFSVLSIIIALLLGIGLLRGEEWARKVTIVFQGVSMLTNLIQLNLFGLVIPFIIVFYLTGQGVKKFFTREPKFSPIFLKMIYVGVFLTIIFNLVFSILLRT